MKAKQVVLITLASACCSTGFAQSSVTLYGIVDTGVELVTHANKTGDRVVRIPAVTGELPSRWGLRGTEDLGGGLAAIFDVESGFNVTSGTSNQGGRLFGRQAWVGFKGPFGTLTFGRQYTMTYWASLDSDLLGPDIYSGLGSLDTYVPNARSDNTFAWKGVYRGVTAGLTYSFGRDSAGTGNSPGQGTCAGSVAGSFVQCRQWSALLRYDTSSFGVAAAYDEQRGGALAATNFFDGVAPAAFTSPAAKDVREQLNGYANIGPVKLGGGWLGRRVSTQTPTPAVKSDMFYLTASYYVLPQLPVEGGVYRIVNAEHDTRGTLAMARTTYLLSKATAVYLQGGYLFNSAHAAYTISQGGGGTTPGQGMGQLGMMVGIRHLF
ncbi:porin [Paraburkholderia sp. D15]|uniref:porin n=1 Tax=Paraburkholderia sp. D15 TaxID=2880218 RepID=UPI00247A52D2|nr:porin [Paraburkholderia sp. D15]WGS53291.1 porin [Paraburkholderia sp. D15]